MVYLLKEKPYDDIEWISNILKTVFELTPPDLLRRYPTHDAVESNTSPILYFGALDSDQYYLLESYLTKLMKENYFHILILTDNDKLYELEDYADKSFLILEPGTDQSSLNPFKSTDTPIPIQITIIMDIIRHVEPNLSPDVDLILRLHLWDLFNKRKNFDIHDVFSVLDRNSRKSDSRIKMNRELRDLIQPLIDFKSSSSSRTKSAVKGLPSYIKINLKIKCHNSAIL